MNLVLYLPIVTATFSAVFAARLWHHWSGKKDARYLMWWAIGVTAYGISTATEAFTSVFGWSEPVFRAWYISGALLGGWPLAQGSVYLLMKKKTADRLTIASLIYIGVASVAVLLTPIVPDLIDQHRLSGDVMEWQWVRAFSPLVNTYALVFLAGGAAWSAWMYWRRSDRPGSRVLGNVLIAVGAILPGIGGSFARLGHVEVLYVTELIGIVLIWAGYAAMTRVTVSSIHTAQQVSATTAIPGTEPPPEFESDATPR